jgi:hypothetical protein
MPVARWLLLTVSMSVYTNWNRAEYIFRVYHHQADAIVLAHAPGGRGPRAEMEGGGYVPAAIRSRVRTQQHVAHGRCRPLTPAHSANIPLFQRRHVCPREPLPALRPAPQIVSGRGLTRGCYVPACLSASAGSGRCGDETYA